jgi:hypothetical protein
LYVTAEPLQAGSKVRAPHVPKWVGATARKTQASARHTRCPSQQPHLPLQLKHVDIISICKYFYSTGMMDSCCALSRFTSISIRAVLQAEPPLSDFPYYIIITCGMLKEF